MTNLLCRFGFHLPRHHTIGGDVYSTCARSCGWTRHHR